MKNCELRPCVVGNRAGMFHRWIDKEQEIITINLILNKKDLDKTIKEYETTGFLPKGSSVQVMRNTFGLVEYEDGTVYAVDPVTIRFTDAVDEQLHFDSYNIQTTDPCRQQDLDNINAMNNLRRWVEE